MSLKSILVTVAFIILGLVYLNISHANSSTPITGKVTKILGGGNNDEIVVQGVVTNRNGSSTLTATACGYMIEVTVDKGYETSPNFQNEVSKVFFELVETACTRN